MIIVRSIYGLKSARALFRVHLAKTLRTMGFKPTFLDRDVWMHKNFLPIPQELNDSVGSGIGNDTSALRPAPNTINSSPMSGTPYNEYMCT